MLHLVQPDDVNAAVGANVAAIRAELGWSQAELAEQWGNALGRTIDPTTITRLERGRRPIPVHELVALGAVLGVGWAELVMAPTIRVAAHEWNTRSVEVNRAYKQICAAVEEYLKAQHFLALATRQVEELGAFDADAAAAQHGSRSLTLKFPPEDVLLTGQIGWRNARVDPFADSKRIHELIAVLRDKGLVEDPGEASGGDDVEHQETQ